MNVQYITNIQKFENFTSYFNKKQNREYKKQIFRLVIDIHFLHPTVAVYTIYYINNKQ
jgi:hypothetical protein